jgi:hypothetical protein
LKVVTNKDLTIDACLWEETDGARMYQSSHPPAPTMTVVEWGTAGASDPCPIIEGETTSSAFLWWMVYIALVVAKRVVDAPAHTLATPHGAGN